MRTEKQEKLGRLKNDYMGESEDDDIREENE